MAFLFFEITKMNLVQGVGINDKIYPTNTDGKFTAEYQLWKGMLKRCYSISALAHRPNYIGCSVSDNFKSYSYFYEWCQTQVGFNNDGWCMDKDIITRGNKIYGENTCSFVPQEINTFFNTRGAVITGYPLGVRLVKGKYAASCCLNGKTKYLGSFDHPQEAYAVYKQFKEKLCKELAKKWYGQIDHRVYDAMMVWTV
jgi:hypothetical protein